MDLLPDLLPVDECIDTEGSEQAKLNNAMQNQLCSWWKSKVSAGIYRDGIITFR
jgi:hypothetical protein